MLASPRMLTLLACLVLLVPAGASPTGGAQAPAEFLVAFHALPSDLAPGAVYAGGTVTRVLPQIDALAVRTLDGDSLWRVARLDPRVRYVEANVEVRADAFTPDDPRFPDQYGPQQARAPDAWDTLLGGSTRDLCIVDTGLRTTHEDLAAAYTRGIDFWNLDADPSDDHGHGTHVAGLAAARIDNGRGIAGIANVNLLVAKALNETGYGTLDAILAGILWCVESGGDVISMSFGTDEDVLSFRETLQYAHARGALLVASAGNAGCDGCEHYPSGYPEVLAVGCVGSDDRLCGFSNRGDALELVAAGKGVVAPWASGDDAYRTLSGTSMSAPHVSGVAALVWNARPDLAASQVRDLLLGTAHDLGPEGCDPAYGHGLVDAQAALAAALGTPSGLVPVAPEPLPPQGCAR